ncbi:biotin--[acetyl-CoA-carboxylase] ligase [uncultured Jatrophihabitans sp.]|uniref:biotin--[acetyl-CoA-carboxylase] ligase n=1 Tax=uncultured Jatrophihabitans sp. TaxID=1610747 RepID=UPI0035CC1B4D
MLDRSPLDPDRIRAAAGPAWPVVRVVERTTSTNADLVADAEIADRTVLAAEEQTAGRGRLDRSWLAPPRSALLFSVALRPSVPVRHWGWLPLLGGVATVEAVRSVAGVDAMLKWPNDVLVDGRKVAGILAQSSGEMAVLGIGLNVSLTEAELPVPTATSLQLAGATGTLDRSAVLGGVLARLDAWLVRWSAADGDASTSGLADAYRAVCSTLGADVRVSLGDGRVLEGRARDVDDLGRVVVDAPDGVHAVSAGDVEHLRNRQG